jgi:hypothetical protein
MVLIRAWYPINLFNPNRRDAWFELIKSKQRFERDARQIDAAIQSYIQWVENEKEADLYVLPMDWIYYFNQNIEKLALDFCLKAYNNKKIVLSFCGGDYGITLPVKENTIVYRQSGYRSKRKPNERTTPFFLSDPISNFLDINEEELFLKKKEELPNIGFCGMAPHGFLVGMKEKTQILLRNAKSLLGFSPFDRQEILSSSNLRFDALQVVKSSQYFKTNYIIRQSYRGGKQTPENRKKTTDEYYQNQIDSDFVICVRGGGNFSIRFFETLAMGRIPIFIDTDSPLPDIGNKDWNDYIIWIDRKDLYCAPEITYAWMKDKDIKEQKIKNRQLWVDYFRLDNFWLNELQSFKLN